MQQQKKRRGRDGKLKEAFSPEPTALKLKHNLNRIYWINDGLGGSPKLSAVNLNLCERKTLVINIDDARSRVRRI